MQRKTKSITRSPELKRQIEDFSRKIAPVYALLKWEWILPFRHIPGSLEIAGQLTSLCDRLLTGECISTETGGLYAEIEEDGNVIFGFKCRETTPVYLPCDPSIDHPPFDSPELG